MMASIKCLYAVQSRTDSPPLTKFANPARIEKFDRVRVFHGPDILKSGTDYIKLICMVTGTHYLASSLTNATSCAMVVGDAATGTRRLAKSP